MGRRGAKFALWVWGLTSVSGIVWADSTSLGIATTYLRYEHSGRQVLEEEARVVSLSLNVTLGEALYFGVRASGTVDVLRSSPDAEKLWEYSGGCVVGYAPFAQGFHLDPSLGLIYLTQNTGRSGVGIRNVGGVEVGLTFRRSSLGGVSFLLPLSYAPLIIGTQKDWLRSFRTTAMIGVGFPLTHTTGIVATAGVTRTQLREDGARKESTSLAAAIGLGF